MIKRTLYFSKPVYLKQANNQLEAFSDHELITSAPIEDIGFLVLDNPQIAYSQSLVATLLENNAAIIYCNSKHMPTGMVLNLDSHHLQHELQRSQIEVKQPVKKALWKHIVERKIRNQIAVAEFSKLQIPELLRACSKEVKSDDSTNREAVAAKSYWKTVMPEGYTRSNRDLLANKKLNYGYAILRAAVARSLSGSGLLPTIGIHHRNQYNSFALADDIMEPYRPFVDAQVLQTTTPDRLLNKADLTKEDKADMLNALTRDVYFPEKKRPLSNGLSLTTASIARHFTDKTMKPMFPKFKKL
ncbi:type II CRISPR-associated endonuclease Cas1 [Salinispira pacifica]|uniref:CRISPR-associated endonuclease Cas1 n=1 Tax=Salinispira pacifica TaxID=1307761 RepID=V5WFM1_9SPIO|nr:type II CRISPR-associated endonuclease Cas1 [Salinispira pacifica]AHC14435.1 CRISPR-associated protein Cas1 [Salinispira pacifica]